MALTFPARYNGLLCGTARPTLGAALTNVATSMTIPAQFNYGGGIALPTIANPYFIRLVLEPDTVNLEVVWATYTTTTTTVTLLRGQENTAAIAHANGVAFVHGPTVADFKSYATRLAARAFAS